MQKLSQASGYAAPSRSPKPSQPNYASLLAATNNGAAAGPHAFQQGLEDASAGDARRWAPGSTLLLAGGVSLLLWVMLALGVAAIV
jgi:hypothetical protein